MLAMGVDRSEVGGIATIIQRSVLSIEDSQRRGALNYVKIRRHFQLGHGDRSSDFVGGPLRWTQVCRIPTPPHSKSLLYLSYTVAPHLYESLIDGTERWLMVSYLTAPNCMRCFCLKVNAANGV